MEAKKEYSLQEELDLLQSFIDGKLKFRKIDDLAVQMYSLVLLVQQEGLGQKVIDRLWVAYNKYCEP